MEERKSLKEAIEAQRERIDELAGKVEQLTELLEESQKMDRLIEAYENEIETL